MNFACRTISLLAIAVISLFPMASHAEDSPVPDTSKIAPDVLRQMDADLVSGKRPVIATIKQDSIYALRENPRLKADLIRFDFNLGELTTAQIRILDTWIRAGNNKIYLLDGDIPKYATLFGLTGGGPDILSGDSAKARQVYDSWKLEDHPVSTDCGRLSFGIFKSRDNDNRSPWFVGQYYLRGLDSQNATLLVSRKADVLCGSFTLGRGTVYFRNSVGGPDMWRWYLNFMHFVMDKRIPGAAESGTTVAGGSAAAGIDSDDKITLKNGDKLQGTILNETFTMQTSYSTMSFERDKIDTIVIEGAGFNIDEMILKAGDKLSGVLQDTVIKIDLSSGGQAEIQKDKIKEIRILKEVKKDEPKPEAN